jgi:hypothetical protein
MRSFMVFVVMLGLGLLYYYQKQHEAKPAAVVTAAAKPAPVAQLTPAPRGQASEYNYMKRALDRAATVRDQSRDQTRASQDP